MNPRLGTQSTNNLRFPCDGCLHHSSNQRYHAPYKKIVVEDGLKCLIFYSQQCFEAYAVEHERYDLYFKVVNN